MLDTLGGKNCSTERKTAGLLHAERVKVHTGGLANGLPGSIGHALPGSVHFSRLAQTGSPDTDEPISQRTAEPLAKGNAVKLQASDAQSRKEVFSGPTLRAGLSSRTKTKRNKIINRVKSRHPPRYSCNQGGHTLPEYRV